MSVIALRETFDTAGFGGKAVQLGEAIRAGLPVPDGFAMSAPWVDRLIRGDEIALNDLHRLLRGLNQTIAVRSSAVGEDSESASFAGQHATCLHIDPEVEAVTTAIHLVWTSGRTGAARAYRQRLGIEGDPQLGIILQYMIEPTAAGVLFSRDPLTGEDVRIIEAAWGLGQAVVAGLVTPDRFRISRSGTVIERCAGYKHLLIRRRAGGGTEELALDNAQAAVLCLDDNQLQALHRLAERCETVYGGAQDLEWGFAGSELFLLQRRPITTGRK